MQDIIDYIQIIYDAMHAQHHLADKKLINQSLYHSELEEIVDNTLNKYIENMTKELRFHNFPDVDGPFTNYPKPH